MIRFSPKKVCTGLSYCLFIVAFIATCIPPLSVSAITTAQKEAFNKGVYYFNTEANTCGTTEAAVKSGPIETTEAQANNAKTIIGIAKTLNLGEKGALIGLMVGLTESNLRNYANDGTYRNDSGDQPYLGTQLGLISLAIPHEAVGNDNDSVGVMQQRAIDGHWGPVDPKKDLAGNIKWLMTPAYAAEAFFAMPAGKLEQKALVRVPGWETMDPALAAQAVQVSKYKDGSNYKEHQAKAQKLVDQYYATAPAIPLPVPLSGQGTAPKPTTSGDCLVASAVTSSKILSKIVEYSWPNYCKADSQSCDGYPNPVTKRGYNHNPADLYYKAVEDAKSTGGYYGDTCYGGGVDCGGFVTIVMRTSGADPKYNEKNGNTTAQLAYLERNSGPGGKYVKIPPDKLQPGDIAVRAGSNGVSGHTWFYIGQIKLTDGTVLKGSSASASQCNRAPMIGPEDTRSSYSWYRLIGQ